MGEENQSPSFVAFRAGVVGAAGTGVPAEEHSV
jgi:hypothetical protein